MIRCRVSSQASAAGSIAAVTRRIATNCRSTYPGWMIGSRWATRFRNLTSPATELVRANESPCHPGNALCVACSHSNRLPGSLSGSRNRHVENGSCARTSTCARSWSHRDKPHSREHLACALCHEGPKSRRKSGAGFTSHVRPSLEDDGRSNCLLFHEANSRSIALRIATSTRCSDS